jgi:phospholipid/cholesterol/gamma-HCH transport system substrate-binding protein
MKSVAKEHGAEILIGLLVVAIAIWFVAYAWGKTGGGSATDAIKVTAQFQNVSGVNVGTEVKMAGIKVGQVTALTLDPKSFQAEATLALEPTMKIPDDSSAMITSEGILGGTYMSLVPGGSSTPLKTGDMILDTQGSVDLMSRVGQVINKSGGSPPASTPAAAPAPAAAAPAPAAAAPTP